VAPLCCWVNIIQENQKVSFGAFLALDAAAKNSNYSKRVVYGLMKIIPNIHGNNFLVTSFFCFTLD